METNTSHPNINPSLPPPSAPQTFQVRWPFPAAWRRATTATTNTSRLSNAPHPPGDPGAGRSWELGSNGKMDGIWAERFDFVGDVFQCVLWLWRVGGFRVYLLKQLHKSFSNLRPNSWSISVSNCVSIVVCFQGRDNGVRLNVLTASYFDPLSPLYFETFDKPLGTPWCFPWGDGVMGSFTVLHCWAMVVTGNKTTLTGWSL